MPGATAQDHGYFVSDRIDIEGYSGATLAFTAVGAETAQLPEGIYDVSADQNVFIKVAATASDVTTANGYRLIANSTITVLVKPNSRIGAIRASADGTLWFHKVG